MKMNVGQHKSEKTEKRNAEEALKRHGNSKGGRKFGEEVIDTKNTNYIIREETVL